MKQLHQYPAFAFLACILLTIVACDKDPQVAPNPHQINFQAPVVGQENYYLRYSGICGELQPTGDTLVLRVKTFDGSLLEFEEIYTEGSPSYYPQSFVYPSAWSIDIIDILPEYRQQSALFFFYGSDSLKLNMAPSISLQQNNCVLWDGQTDFTGDKIGTVNKFRVGNIEYAQKKIVSCVPIILDLDAYLVYDRNNIYSSFTSSTGGWEPLEDPFVNAFALIEVNQ